MSESRYLLSFAMLLTGALVICGPMVLVWSTAEQDTSWLDTEPQIAPYAITGKGWEATVRAEADLPPAVPLEAADGYVAYLPEVRPVLDVLTAADGSNAQVQVAALEEEIIAESSGASVAYAAETAPPVGPPAADTHVAELDETDPTPDMQHEAQAPEAKSVQVAELDETQKAPVPTPEETDIPEEPAGIDDSTSSTKTAPDIVPPLPSRRPPIKTAEVVVAQEGQETSSLASSSSDERRNDETPPQRWRPMALAPANADIPAPPKLSSPAPKPTMSTAAHRSKVWLALARAKPRAGARGSATVTFSIGANGALRGARIAKSSGNAKIDQMALATVRKAGPFPPPPGIKLGAASYSIRMDFR